MHSNPSDNYAYDHSSQSQSHGHSSETKFEFNFPLYYPQFDNQQTLLSGQKHPSNPTPVYSPTYTSGSNTLKKTIVQKNRVTNLSPNHIFFNCCNSGFTQKPLLHQSVVDYGKTNFFSQDLDFLFKINTGYQSVSLESSRTNGDYREQPGNHEHQQDEYQEDVGVYHEDGEAHEYEHVRHQIIKDPEPSNLGSGNHKLGNQRKGYSYVYFYSTK